MLPNRTAGSDYVPHGLGREDRSVVGYEDRLDEVADQVGFIGFGDAVHRRRDCCAR